MAEITQKLKPWTTPNFAIVESPPSLRQGGFTPAPSIPLGDVPAEALASLCNQFRAEVFRKANKHDVACPWSVSPGDDDDSYETACGKNHLFIDGTPADNNYAFCPYCGKRLQECDNEQ